MRLLFLTWRCPNNPKAGGAEFLTFELAKRLAARGDEVEWFAASFPGAPPSEQIEGVRIVRAGRQWSVHLHAYLRYRRQLPRSFDAVIDEVNTVPFFTPRWADIPTIMLVFQLAREVWWYESRFPLSLIGYLAEQHYLRLYRHVPTVTISESTKTDLLRLRFTASCNVLPLGIEPVAVNLPPKDGTPTFIYVGRLAPSKRVVDIVRAFDIFRREEGGQLWIVGDGAPGYIRRVRGLVARLRLADSVQFFGRLTPPDKHQLMARAYALLVASVREGWGLVVTEANACGTPAIGYHVHGIRDSIRHERTGLTVDSDPSALAGAMLRLWRDKTLYGRLKTEARRWAESLSLDASAEILRDQVAELVWKHQVSVEGPRAEDVRALSQTQNRGNFTEGGR